MHSKYSDGSLSPVELVSRAKAANLKGISLTDHDTVDGIPVILEAANKNGLYVIPGIELTTYYKNVEVHVLGYFLDYTSKSLNAFLKQFRDDRYNRMKKMIAKINEIGFDVQFEEVQKLSHGKNLGRPHLARVLVNKGYVKDINEAFEKYIGENGPAYVPRKRISSSKGIELIRSAGGVPIIAHPLLIKNFTIDFLFYAKSIGAQGFEVEYPYEVIKNVHINLAINNVIRKYCTENNLIMTGGTDFHDPHESAPIGSKCVSSEVVEQLKSLAEL